jgi:hypothetical protein
MLLREELQKFHGVAAAEHQLRVVCRELQRPAATVEAASNLLVQIDPDLLQGLPAHISPAELDHVIHWLADASQDLHTIVAALKELEQR